MPGTPQVTVNPYAEIGAQVSAGLNSIIGSLPGSPAISDLVNSVYSYVISVYYPGGTTTQLEIELKSIARTAINSYVNNLVMGGQAGYNAAQFGFIELLIGNSVTSNLPFNAVSDRIANVEDNLTDNQLTVTEQTPLLLATTIGTNSDAYWIAVMLAGSGPWWTPGYITNNSFPLLPFFDAAAMNGALAGYAATPSSMIEPSINFVTNKMVSALIGALTVTAGKVIFNWIPRIQHMNPAAMLNLGSGPVGFGGGSATFGIKGYNPNLGAPGHTVIGIIGAGGTLVNQGDFVGNAAGEKAWADSIMYQPPSFNQSTTWQ